MNNQNQTYEIGGEIDAYRLTDKTMSITPKISPAPKKIFKELIVGKIKLALYDFSNGKGDNGIYAYYNLDLREFKYLYERAKTFYMPQPLYLSKIHNAWPEKKGRYAGYCKAFRCAIVHTPTITRNGKTEPMRFPWSITVTNGYAMPAENGLGEERNSFVECAKVSVKMNDMDFFDRLEVIHSYIESYRNLIAKKSLEQNLNELQAYLDRNTYNENINEPVSQGQTEQVNNVQANNNTQMQNPDRQETKPVQTIHQMQMVIESDFQAMEDGDYAKCMIGGVEYLIFFPPMSEKLKKQLVDAKNRKSAVNALLYQDKEQRICFYKCA